MSGFVFSNSHSSDTLLTDFVRIDSLNLFRKDKNTEVLTLLVNEDVKKVYQLINWTVNNDRGTITKLICDSSRSGNDLKYMVDFRPSIYNRDKILYVGDKNQTLILFARLSNQDTVLNARIDSLFQGYNLKKDKIKANSVEYRNLAKY